MATRENDIIVEFGGRQMTMAEIKNRLKKEKSISGNVWINTSEGKAYYAKEDGSDGIIDLLED